MSSISAFACSCGTPPLTKISELVDQYENIFTGRVLQTREHNIKGIIGNRVATFEAVTLLKGEKNTDGKLYYFHHLNSLGSCDDTIYNIGQEYVIFAIKKSDGVLHPDHWCGASVQHEFDIKQVQDFFKLGVDSNIMHRKCARDIKSAYGNFIFTNDVYTDNVQCMALIPIYDAWLARHQ